MPLATEVVLTPEADKSAEKMAYIGGYIAGALEGTNQVSVHRAN
jgi:hypothetical protein